MPARLSPGCGTGRVAPWQRPRSAAVVVWPSPARGSPRVWRWSAAAAAADPRPPFGCAAGTAGRPAPAAAASGASGLAAAPPALAICTPEVVGLSREHREKEVGGRMSLLYFLHCPLARFKEVSKPESVLKSPDTGT